MSVAGQTDIEENGSIYVCPHPHCGALASSTDNLQAHMFLQHMGGYHLSDTSINCPSPYSKAPDYPLKEVATSYEPDLHHSLLAYDNDFVAKYQFP